MAQVHNFSFGAFEWFVGVVEDRDDPKKLGRLRVRAFGFHGDAASIPTEDLPWAMVLQDITSSAKAGVGSSPVGAQVGTHVVGFFADGKNAQTPIIMGSLAGEPEDEPDTNRLTRGEELEQTVVQEKKDSAIVSKADANAVSGLSAATNLTNKIKSTVAATTAKMSGVKDSFAKVGDLSLMADLNGISSVFTQIAQAPAMAAALKGQLDWQISSFKSRVEMLRNLDVEEYAQALGNAQVRDVEASLAALKSLDFDDAMSAIQSVPMAIGQISRLTDSIKAMGDLGGIVSTIKGLAKSIPNIGSIAALGKTISSANVWNEPLTPAAPMYPLNKIMETEGGHIEEYDDTKGSERYHRYHPAGTFTEVHPDGTTVDKIVKDRYSVVMGDDYLHVEGNVKVNIVGNATIVVNGDATTTVSGNKVDVVKGDYSLAVGGNMSTAVGGSFEQSANAQFTVKAPRIDLN
jgi:hypothetical protein